MHNVGNSVVLSSSFCSQFSATNDLNSEYFEMVFDSQVPVALPSVEKISLYSAGSWGKDMSGVIPSMPIVGGVEKRVKIFRLTKGGTTSQRCVDFIKSQKAILPNVFGLAGIEMTILENLPKDIKILGFDERESLSTFALNYKKIPFLRVASNGHIKRGWVSWSDKFNKDCCFVLFCD